MYKNKTLRTKILENTQTNKNYIEHFSQKIKLYNRRSKLPYIYGKRNFFELTRNIFLDTDLFLRISPWQESFLQTGVIQISFKEQLLARSILKSQVMSDVTKNRKYLISTTAHIEE